MCEFIHSLGLKTEESENIKLNQYNHKNIKSQMQSQMMRMKQNRPELLGRAHPAPWQVSPPLHTLGAAHRTTLFDPGVLANPGMKYSHCYSCFQRHQKMGLSRDRSCKGHLRITKNQGSARLKLHRVPSGFSSPF